MGVLGHAEHVHPRLAGSGLPWPATDARHHGGWADLRHGRRAERHQRGHGSRDQHTTGHTRLRHGQPKPLPAADLPRSGYQPPRVFGCRLHGRGERGEHLA